MKSAPSTAVYVALGAVLIVTAGWSQTNNDEKATGQWRRVQSLVPGAQIEVSRFKEKTVRGAVVSTADSAITVAAKNNQRISPGRSFGR